MPLFYQQHINQNTKLAIWKIEESEDFFAGTIPLQREITHPHKRLQHLAGRYLLRYLFPDFPYNEILIADTRKPFLPTEAYHFSISHCGNYAAAIVSKIERVGIDIEISTEKILKIAHKFVNKEEMKMVNDIESRTFNGETRNHKQESTIINHNAKQSINQIINHLTLIWCAKETMFKWYGLGNVDFKTMLEVNFETIETEGTFDAVIRINNDEKHININYRFFGKICLTFTHTI